MTDETTLTINDRLREVGALREERDEIARQRDRLRDALAEMETKRDDRVREETA